MPFAMFCYQALLDLLDQVEDAIMEEELPIDPANKGGQRINGHNTNIHYTPVNGDPTFDSFLVLEVCLVTFSC